MSSSGIPPTGVADLPEHAAVERCLEGHLARTAPRPAFREALRAQVVQLYEETHPGRTRQRTSPLAGWSRSWARAAAAIIVALAVTGAGVGVAAGSAMPGDPLYLAKRGIELVTTSFVSATDRPQHLLELASARIEELNVAAERGLWSAAEALAKDILRLEGDAAAAGTDVGDSVSSAVSALERLLLAAPVSMRTSLNGFLAELRALIGLPAQEGETHQPPAQDPRDPGEAGGGSAESTDGGSSGGDATPQPSPEAQPSATTNGADHPVTSDGDEPGDTCVPPGHGGAPPGQGGVPPGQCAGPPTGQEDPAASEVPSVEPAAEPSEAPTACTPPGRGELPPGKGGDPSEKGGPPPGHGGTPPGQCETSP